MKNTESVLERILKEQSPHPSPFKKEDLPYFDGPWFDIGRRAVEVLTDANEIRDFMNQYVQYIQDKYGLNRNAAEKSAKSGVGYCTGYADDEQANRWFDALPDISHPIMRRERPFKDGDNVKDYYLIGNSADPEIRAYLSRVFSEDLPILGYAALDGFEPVKGKDNTSYFAIRVKPTEKQKVMGSAGAYLLLAGYIKGLESRMQADLGKTCELSLEKTSKNKS